MNTGYGISKPEYPMDGDMFYDTDIGTIKMYISGDWHGINNEHNSRRFYWIKDTKLPYAKILNGNWFMDHHAEIMQWLNETKAGTYSPELSSIIFESKESATFFQLKWG